MTKKTIPLIILSLLMCSVVYAAPFDKDVPYQDAVPNFLEAITDATAAVKDPLELNAIENWESLQRARLPEFLDDLITIAQRLEAEGTPEFIFEQYNAFARKWQQVERTYPGLAELDPILSPLIDQLLAGLPTLGPPSSDNPLSGLVDLYKAMEIEDPWGLGGFFVIDPIPVTNKEISVTELLNETKSSGVKNKEIISRETVATLNGIVVYFEIISNGQIIQKFVNFRDPSIIHETLAQMIQNNEDPMIIQAVQDIVDLIDFNLQLALDSGVLDECSYSFIYRKTFGNVLQNCTDIINNSQDFMALTKFDPFDDVNQVELSEPDQIVAPLDHPGALALAQPQVSLTEPLSTNEILADYQKGLVGTSQTFVMGLLFPAYLFSIVGFFRGL